MKENIDTVGLSCPLAVHQIAQKAEKMKPGDILEARGDCPTFEQDVRGWCEQMHKNIVSVSMTDPFAKYGRKIEIQKIEIQL
jgi:TusA-related sulfurtransferase